MPFCSQNKGFQLNGEAPTLPLCPFLKIPNPRTAFDEAMRFMRCGVKSRSVLWSYMAPGWVKTDLGGPDAPLSIGDSIPSLVEVLIEKQPSPKIRVLELQG